MAIKALAHLQATQIRWRDVLDTPAVVIDLDIVERNLRRGAEFARQQEVGLRPHIKTHKLPVLAQAQLELGAIGITAQKLSEAEVMVEAGIRDVLLSYNIVGDQKLSRLRRLAGRCTLRTVADHPTVAAGLARTFASDKDQIGVLVEIDGGLNRCGATSVERAVEIAQLIAPAPGTRFDGFMIYPAPDSWQQALTFLSACNAAAQDKGLRTTVLSTGGTPDMMKASVDHMATEYRAGTYIYNDRSLVAAGAVDIDDCALSVWATVVSTPTKTRAVVDAGSKSLSSDLFGLQGFGLIKQDPLADLFALSEEHGHARFAEGSLPDIGERVEIIPNHSCVVSNLVDRVHFVRGAFYVSSEPVAARGTVV